MNNIFPGFFFSGFECSTFIWAKKGRCNLVSDTQHDMCMEEDYDLLRSLGITVSREGILWPMVDHQGVYDFSSLDPAIAAMKRTNITPIWDLCHYGYPEDLDPLSSVFTERFAHYSQAAAAYIAAQMDGPYFFTPINEITYFSNIGGWMGWAAPHLTSTQARCELVLMSTFGERPDSLDELRKLSR